MDPMATNKTPCRIETELLGKEQSKEEQNASWRVFRIMSELVSGFDLLRKYGLAVTFFGTSRGKENHEVYAHARELAGRLSKEGFTVITGGGGGVMEAANRGATESGGNSVGLNIDLPEEQGANKFITNGMKFNYFFTRKVMLSFASEVYVFFPGGFGTLDEFFEIITLIQTKKIGRIPVILVDTNYWTPLLEWVDKTVYEKYKNIDKEDMNIYHLVNSVDEAMSEIIALTKNAKS
jgi:uncharacterized protein (TIGR00730 family)